MSKNQSLTVQTFFVLILFVIIVLASCSKVKRDIGKQNNWINFKWHGDSIGNRYFDKTYITIPFSIEGIPHKFESQFDLGATSTMVYGNSIKPYLEEYPNISLKLDTINKKHWLQNKNVGHFKNINFKLDTVLFKNQELVYFNGFGEKLTKDSVKTKTIKHVGTIGANLFQEKSLIINFPKKSILILDSLSAGYKENTTFVDIKIDKGRVKVPVTINGSIRYFLFDTGSSMFPLLVTKENIKLISNSKFANDTLNISSWGEHYDVHGYSINSTIGIGGLKIETKNMNVYDSKKEFKQFYEQEKIMGIMGNSFFLGKEIIIDFKNKKFGIIN